MPIFSDCFRWLNRRGAQVEPPQAWAGGWLALDLPLKNLDKDWQSLELRLDSLILPLMLVRQKEGLQLRAEWPALGAGFCQLQLWQRGSLLASERLFVGARHLNAEQWLTLLADLRYRLPVSCLLSLRAVGGRVPLAPASLKANPAEEFRLLQRLILGPAMPGSAVLQPGLLLALDWLAHSASAEPVLKGQWQPIRRVRRPAMVQLARHWHQPQAILWEQAASIELDQPQNRFVAGVVGQSLRHLQALRRYLEHSGDFAQARQLTALGEQLESRWRRHPLAGLPESLELPAHPQILQLPAYALCLRVWLALRQGFAPHLEGFTDLPYADLALLYQHWCLLQILEQLLNWGQTHDWQVAEANLSLRRGNCLLSLQQDARRLSLYVEASYEGQPVKAEFYSLSHTQRPDISLKLLQKGQPSKLLVFDTKYRAASNLPLKEDLDKLHAYRDAIRSAEGQPALWRAILLYPGSRQSYREALEAWQLLPGQNNPLPLASLLTQWLKT